MHSQHWIQEFPLPPEINKLSVLYNLDAYLYYCVRLCKESAFLVWAAE